MSYDYDPSKDGLVSLGYVDFEPDGCYEWDGVSVYVRPSDKRFFWEYGSGCSCNAPMEYIYKLEDFDSGTFAEFLGGLVKRLSEELSCEYNKEAVRVEILKSFNEVMEEAVKYA